MFARKGITPLVATILLVAFSVGLGALVMSWGEDYIEEKAEFVQGVQEVKAGCETVNFAPMTIGGVPQFCKTPDAIEVWLDNGASDIFNIHARVAGRDGVIVTEEIIQQPLLKEQSVKSTIPYKADIGKVLQVKLTPKIYTGNTVVSCSKQAIMLENIQNC